MFKNRQLLDMTMRKRITEYFYAKYTGHKSITMEEFKPWLENASEDAYRNIIIKRFSTANTALAGMSDGIKKLDNDFDGVEEIFRKKPIKVVFDYDIYMILNESSSEVIAMYLLSENPLTAKQVNSIKSNLGLSCRIIDDNICELS